MIKHFILVNILNTRDTKRYFFNSLHFFDRNSTTNIGPGINSDAVLKNQKLARELQEPFTQIKCKVYLSFKENI